MRLRPAVASAFLAVLVVACGRGGGVSAPAPLNPIAIDAVEFETDAGGIADSLTVVIRDQETLAEMWSRATDRQQTPPPLPQVDFQRNMLLLVAGGRMPAGYDVRIDSIGIRQERVDESGRTRPVLVVQYTFTHACRRIARDAYPLEIVRVRRQDGEVRFDGRRDPPAACR
jgi:hypothetical protein